MARLQHFATEDTRNAVGAAQFQAPDDKGVMALRSVTNAVISNDLRVRALPSTQVAAEGIDWANGVSAPAGLILHDKGAGEFVLNPHGTASTIVEGLDPDANAVFQEHQGLVYWWCGADRGRITAQGVNLPWALPQATSPTVASIAGSMPAGRYLTTVTWVDVVGAESGASASTETVLASTGGLRISPVSVPADAAVVRVYVSPVNGQFPVWVADRAVGASWPFDVTAAPSQTGLYSSILSRTIGLSPLPTGAGMTTRGGFLVVWGGSVVSFSAGTWAHLYDPRRHFFSFPSKVMGCGGLNNGIWVVTEHDGAYWIAGQDLTKATIPQSIKASRKYAMGAAVVPTEFTGIQTKNDVAVFVSDEGLVFGTDEAELVAPVRLSQLWDVEGKTAQVVPVEFSNIKTLAVSIV